MDLSRLLIDLVIISLLLVAGTFIRARVKYLQKAIIPASVIGGIIGLILGENVIGLISITDAQQFASVLINVVFAGLFIGRIIPGFRQLGKTAAAQTAYAYFNSFGQIAIGLFVVVLFGLFGFHLHPIFGLKLFAGFQGGVGTAAAVAPMVEEFGWSAADALAVGIASAVIGIMLSVIVGIIIVNFGIRRNYTVNKQYSKQGIESPTFPLPDKRKSIGQEITSPEAGSTVVFNFGIMGVAILIGYLIHQLAVTVPPLSFLPVFPFVLVGSIFVQYILQFTGTSRYVDRKTVESISSFSLDVLIVASLMAINLTVIMAYAVPLLTMILLAVIFNVWQMFWLAPRILPGAWFEKGIAEFGQSTGATPQAMLMLRMVDPRLETDALQAFALKMFLFSPIMFPAVLLLMPLIVARGALFFLPIVLALMLLILGICRLTCWQRRSLSEPGSEDDLAS